MSFLKKYHLSEAMKASVALMMTSFIQKGLVFCTGPIFTRLLSTEEYGRVSIFYSYFEIILIFSSLCLSKGVFNNGMLEYKKDKECFTLSMFSLSCLSTVIVYAVVLFINQYVYTFLDFSNLLLLMLFLILFFEPALSIWTTKQRYEYKYIASCIITIVSSVLAPVIAIIAIKVFPQDKISSRIIGEKGCLILFYVGIATVLIIKAKGKIKIKYWKYALKFNLPLIPHYLSLRILNHFDRIMIERMVNAKSAGIYSVSYSAGELVKVFWMSINASLIPWTYEKCEKEDFNAINNLTKVILNFYGFICIAICFLAPEIMNILAPTSYMDGLYIIPSVISGTFFSSLYYVFANIIYYYKKPKYVMYASCISCVVNVVLNYIFIRMFGYYAAGYTTLVSYIIQSIIDYIAMRKVLPDKKIYDVKYLLFISAIVIISSMLAMTTYNNYIIRYLLFIAVIVVMIPSIKKSLPQIVNLIKRK